MWECSGNQRESKPRASTSVASVAGSIAYSVGNIMMPWSTGGEFPGRAAEHTGVLGGPSVVHHAGVAWDETLTEQERRRAREQLEQLLERQARMGTADVVTYHPPEAIAHGRL